MVRLGPCSNVRNTCARFLICGSAWQLAFVPTFLPAIDSRHFLTTGWLGGVHRGSKTKSPTPMANTTASQLINFFCFVQSVPQFTHTTTPSCPVPVLPPDSETSPRGCRQCFSPGFPAAHRTAYQDPNCGTTLPVPLHLYTHQIDLLSSSSSIS